MELLKTHMELLKVFNPRWGNTTPPCRFHHAGPPVAVVDLIRSHSSGRSRCVFSSTREVCKLGPRLMLSGCPRAKEFR